MIKPKVSFFGTIFKQKEFLHNYFLNLLNIEGFDKCELILVVPDTYDEEEKAIYRHYQSHKNIKVTFTPRNHGIYDSWNMGIKQCQSDILCNANADDRKLPNCLEDIERYIKSGVDVVYGDYFVADNRAQLEFPFSCGRRSVLPEFTIEGLIKYCLPGHSPFWNRRIFDSRGFRQDFGSAGDLDFWLRACRSGATFKKLNKLLSVYYFNPSGLSTNKDGEVKRQAVEQEIKRQYSKALNYSGPIGGELSEIWVNT